MRRLILQKAEEDEGERGFIWGEDEEEGEDELCRDQKHARVCKLPKRSPNAVSRHRLKTTERGFICLMIAPIVGVG